MTTTYSHCRDCNFQGERKLSTYKKDLGVDNGGVFDACGMCGSTDIDILSDAGVKHEVALREGLEVAS